MFVSLKRIIKSGWLSFSRDGGQNVATVLIMAITVFFVSVLFLSNVISQSLLLALQEKVDISVYFKEAALENEILDIKEEIAKIPEVKDIEYVPKEKALKKFIERHKEDPILMESLTQVGENPFVASLNIRAWQASQYAAVSSFLENSSFRDLIEKVDYYQRKPLIERVSSMAAGLNKLGIISSLVLGTLAILVVFNTIRLAIYSSREEISIMRLVGADNWFIQGPFLVQGAISGGLAVLVTLLVSLATFFFLSSKLEHYFPGFNIWSYFIGNFWLLLLIQISVGIGLGIISSWLATRRYLKV